MRAASFAFNNQLAVELGCDLLENGAVKVNEYGQTSVESVFAAGDVAHPFFHQIAAAVAGGAKAGAILNNQLNKKDFENS